MSTICDVQNVLGDQGNAQAQHSVDDAVMAALPVHGPAASSEQPVRQLQEVRGSDHVRQGVPGILPCKLSVLLLIIG